jgi:hypothetical protein
MKIDSLQTYQDVVSYLDKQYRTRHLLLGNGFSMAYDSNIFSYNALGRFVENTKEPTLQKLFSTIKTKNFEQIMQQLDSFCVFAKAFSTDKELISKIQDASEKLKVSLIEAVKELHPEHVFSIPEEKSKKCFSFLESYLSKNGKIFSTNYDILLYWVLMRNNASISIDGFGRELEETGEFIPEDEKEFSELRWGKHKSNQSIFYLHGSLPLFDNGIDIVKEEYESDQFLLEKIENRMANFNYPIFVTAGNAKEKLQNIMHNKYLSFCYDKLASATGSIVTFGFNFGEYDTHIIDAINKATYFRKEDGGKLLSIFIGVYTDSDLEHIEAIEHKFKCKVNKYDARTANIW